MKKENKESGQILVIMVVAMVAILGFTALAIDGSMVYNARRMDQSTADSAALAGAGAAAQYIKVNLQGSYVCGQALDVEAQNRARARAIASAQEDGVTLSNNDISNNLGVQTICGKENGVPYIDIHTVISSTSDTTFLKVITKDPLETVIESVARIYVSTSFAGGNALISLGQTCDANGGIYALGNAQVRIQNGGAYSSSCISATGSSKLFAYSGVVQYTGDGNLITPQNAPVLILNDADPTTEPNMYESLAPQIDWYGPNVNIDASLLPVQAQTSLPAMSMDDMTAITPPVCGAAQATTTPSGSGATIQPGTYSSLTWNSNGSGNLTLSPGVYCFTGAVAFNGGAAKVFADNTTLYFGPSSTLANAFNGNNLQYSMNGSTVYITNGSFNIGKVIALSNSKFYLGNGDFLVDGSAKVTMDNSSIYLNNGTFNVTAGGTMSAANITIFIKQGSFIIDGGAIVNLSAPGCSTSACGVGPAIPGVLVLMAETNTGTFVIDNGTGTAHNLNGTCFCPNALATIAGGTSTTTTNVQLIAKRISVSNGAKLNMNLDEATLYSQGSTTIQVQK